MLSQRLQRAKIELQSHQCWLKAFVSKPQSRRALHPNTKLSSIRCQQNVRPRLPSQPYGSQKAIGVAWLATKRAKVKRRASPEIVPPSLKEAIEELRIRDVANIYYSLKDRGVLESRHFRTIAQCLHHCWRVERRTAEMQKRRVQKEDLVALAEELVKDVMTGSLTPSTRAHVHLLGFFKESGVLDAGVNFWRWLEGQDELFVNSDVYGAAIELLAANGAPLSEMEDLYQQALSRFPGAFAAYHLSPEAVLPDRNKATTLKGVPISLLQGILTARLLHGDTRNAYLALDTALRLYPDQTPPRFLMLFLEERPLLEAYTVFALACRGGIVIPRNQFRHLISALRTSSDLASPERHALAVRAMLSALYMYVGIGGVIGQNIINELVISITQFVRLNGIVLLEAKQKQQLVKELMDVIRASLAIFARYGAVPGVSAFNSIITNLGGFGHSKQIIGIALSDAHALGIEANEVTRRSVLTAAGMLEDKDFVEKAWKQLAQARADAQRYPDATDWHCFIKAVHSAGHVDFAREEFEGLKKSLPVGEHYGILSGLDDSGLYHLSHDSSEVLDLSSLFGEIKTIRLDLQLIDERTKDRPKVQDFRDQQLPMTLWPSPSKAPLPEAALRATYDELTMEPRPFRALKNASLEASATGSEQSDSTPTVVASSEPAAASTNIPFSTLRYENWKSINWLLEQAEANDHSYHKLVDDAIAASAVPPQRTRGIDLASVDKVGSYGLSDTLRTEKKNKRERPATEEEIDKGRSHILRLRGRQL